MSEGRGGTAVTRLTTSQTSDELYMSAETAVRHPDPALKIVPATGYESSLHIRRENEETRSRGNGMLKYSISFGSQRNIFDNMRKYIIYSQASNSDCLCSYVLLRCIILRSSELLGKYRRNQTARVITAVTATIRPRKRAVIRSLIVCSVPKLT